MSVSTRLSFLPVLLLLVLSAAAAQAQAAKCRPCEIAHERCSVNCLGREGDNAIGSCLIRCDNAAALCSCDEPATLTAEDYVERFGLKVITQFSGACNSTTPCGSAYGACTNWSSFSYCGDPYCGYALGCGECDEWRCEPGGPAEKQDLERYRVCFDQQGQPCTEYQRSSTTGACGC